MLNDQCNHQTPISLFPDKEVEYCPTCGAIRFRSEKVWNRPGYRTTKRRDTIQTKIEMNWYGLDKPT